MCVRKYIVCEHTYVCERICIRATAIAQSGEALASPWNPCEYTYGCATAITAAAVECEVEQAHMQQEK